MMGVADPNGYCNYLNRVWHQFTRGLWSNDSGTAQRRLSTVPPLKLPGRKAPIAAFAVARKRPFLEATYRSQTAAIGLAGPQPARRARCWRSGAKVARNREVIASAGPALRCGRAPRCPAAIAECRILVVNRSALVRQAYVTGQSGASTD